jgi:COP9 signalosome complex subunit 7
LESGEFKPIWELLNIFAYGTYKDYSNRKGLLCLPELNATQTKKLKYLTIVTLSESEKCIPYKTLLEELSIADIRELEDLIIEAIYAGREYIIEEC